MNRKIWKNGARLLAGAALALLPLACGSSKTEGGRVTCTALAPLECGGGQGVSAPYAGRIGEALVVAGGCNFPDVPAADGGDKVFYRTIYRLEQPAEDESAGWQAVGQLPVAAAYGVSVTVPQGIVCVGGSDGSQSLRRVWLLRADGEAGYATDSLPDLPEPLDNAAGAYCGDAVYVAGGQSNGDTSPRAFRLAWPGGRQWEELPTPPGGARLQPVAAAAGKRFCLMGGYVPPSDDGDEARLQAGGCMYDPATGQWTETAPLRLEGDTALRALVGAVGAASADGRRLLFAGGVNGERFLRAVNRPLLLQQAQTDGDNERVADLEAEGTAYLRHPEAWYRFGEAIVAYDPAADTWTRVADFPQLARAGAALIPWDNRWYVVNGESKPGVRSCDVTAVDFPASR